MSKTKKSVTKPITAEQNITVGCCGGPAPDNLDACCVKDAQAKAEGKTGGGCHCSEQSSPG